MIWLNELNLSILHFLDTLKIFETNYKFKPTIKHNQNKSCNIELGFSNYALKIYTLLDQIENIPNKDLVKWIDYIKSFQNIESKYPQNSFIDGNYIKLFNQQNNENLIKLGFKKTVNFVAGTNFKSNKIKIENYIRAETKQSIATLLEINEKIDNKFKDFPKNEFQLNKFLTNLNWKYPWSSGGQLAAVALFSKSQMETKDFDKNKQIFSIFLSKLVKQDGMYYESTKPISKKELVNGAMKIISALDWLDIEVHYPKKIIDTCLNIDPESEGCDIVDIVYVLYRCSKYTNYKKKEIVDYYKKILDIIFDHYKPDEGGFSYYKDSCQTNYYDVKFSISDNIADIHGTLLMLWAVVMIMDVIEINCFNFQIIKP